MPGGAAIDRLVETTARKLKGAADLPWRLPPRPEHGVQGGRIDWIEGHVEGVTGWSIGGIDPDGDQSKDANEIYLKLERVILPLYYGLPFAYAEVMRSAIALNGSFFNTQRMVEQYVRNAYFPEATVALAAVGD